MHSVSRLGLLLVAWLSGAALAAELNEVERRGQQLYTQGTAASGNAVRAEVGNAGMSLPGSVLPCGNCHGEDARGRPEGGVIPSDIRVSQLTKAYGVRSASGRRHPPYQLSDFIRAVRQGVDPAGTVLDAAMPRYQIGDADLTDLWAYLGVVERLSAPGVDEQRITIATLVPDPDRAGIGRDIRQVLEAYFDDINASGGIYGRRLQLLVEPLDGVVKAPAAMAAERLFARQPALALLSPVALTGPQALADWAERQQVPLLAPFSRRSGEPGGLSRYSFYLLGDQRVRLQVLIESAAAQALQQGGTAVLLADRGAVDGEFLVPSNLRRLGYADREELRQQLTTLVDPPPVVVVHEGTPEALQLVMDTLGRAAQPPLLYALAGAGMERWQASAMRYGGRLELAYPMRGSDLSAADWATFERFRARHRLQQGPVQPVLHAYVAAKLLVEGLKGAGKQLDREALIVALERLYQYQSGLMPPFTFGPNRRIGARGAHLVAFDPAAGRPQRAGRWVELQEPH